MKYLAILFSLICIMFCNNSILNGQCTSDAGTFGASTLSCWNEDFTVSASGDQVLDTNDVLIYIAHTNNSPLTGNVIGTSTTGTFANNGQYPIGTSVTIFVGNPGGPNGYDLSDPCMDLSAPTAINLTQTPVLSCSDVQLNCAPIPPMTTCTVNEPCTFDWAHLAGTNDPLNVDMNQGPGVYCVTATNFNGCTTEACITVTDDTAPPTFTLPSDVTITCNTLIVLLDNIQPSNCTFFWSGPNGFTSTEEVPPITESGTYTVQVMGPNLCVETGTVNVTVATSLPDAFAVGGILNCLTGTITLSGSSSTPGVTFTWTDPTGAQLLGQNPTVDLAGEYILFVADPINGCFNTATAFVEDNAFSATTTINTNSILGLTCLAPVVTLVADNPAVNASYIWTDGSGATISTSNDVEVTAPDLYSVTITDVTGNCTSVQTMNVPVNITPPDVSTANTIEIACASGIAQLTATSTTPDVEYHWEDPTGQILMGQNQDVYYEGNYTVVVTDIANGCTASATTNVFQSNLVPYIAQLDGPQPILNCLTPSLTYTIIPEISNPPNVQYSWIFNQNQIGTGLTQTLSMPGTYAIRSTNTDNGCSSYWEFEIEEVLNPLTWNAAVVNVTCNGAADGFINLNLTLGVSYLIDWSNGQSQALSINDLPAGIYDVTVTDVVSGCTVTESYAVEEPAPLDLNFQYNSSSTPPQVEATATGGTPPYTYDWGVSFAQGSILPSPPVGIYFCQVTDANGCGVTKQYVQLPQFDAWVGGLVYKDENQNCIQNATDPDLAGWLVQAYNAVDTFYATSRHDGSFLMNLKGGSYDIRTIPPNPLWTLCAASYPIIAIDFDSIQQDIGAIALTNCPALEVDISTPLLRRCFDNNYYTVQYINQGTFTAQNAYVEVQFPADIEYVSSVLTAVDLGNNLYRFDIGNVGINESGQFKVRVKVLCSATLGQSHCTEAHIYPDTLCTSPNPQWNGDNIEVYSICDGQDVQFVILNTGTGAMTTGVDYIIVEDFVMLMQGTTPALGAGDSIILTLPANGAAYYMSAQQTAFNPSISLPTSYVEGCTSSGNFTVGLGVNYTTGSYDPYLDIDCTNNIGSYDPNDKQGFPIGYGSEHYILPETPLEYLIRFQNTGTDTAFNVVILDTLSEHFNKASIRPLASSHPYTFELIENGVARFAFDNILLPDSNINEPLSHGFIRYRILPKADVPLETGITNSAAIYFDFNDPIITNTTLHTVGIDFMLVGLWEPKRPNIDLQVSPNPFFDRAIFTLKGLEIGEKIQVQIVQLDGKIVQSFSSTAPTFVLEKNALQKGMYFVQLSSESGQIGFTKIVVK